MSKAFEKHVRSSHQRCFVRKMFLKIFFFNRIRYYFENMCKVCYKSKTLPRTFLKNISSKSITNPFQANLIFLYLPENIRKPLVSNVFRGMKRKQGPEIGYVARIFS